MKKYSVVMLVVLVLSLFSILFIVIRGNTLGRNVPEKVSVAEIPTFPVTKEKLPENLEWQSGQEQKIFSSSEAKKGGILHTATMTYPTTFRQYGPNSNTAFRSYLDDNDMSLVEIHPETSEYYPGLAKSWAIGPDKRTVYYKLDPDAKWSDGRPVTADDFIFALKFMRSDSLLAPYTKEYTLKYLERILKFDDHTIAIRLPTVKADLIYNCNMTVKPYHYYGKFREVEAELPISQAMNVLLHDEKEISPEIQEMYDQFEKDKAAKKADLVEPKITIKKDDVREDWVSHYQWRVQPRTGPYIINSWVKGKEIVLKRNENWWAKDKKFYKNRYNVDYINIKLIRDLNIIFEHFKKGNIDSFNLRESHYWHVKAKYLSAVERGYMNKLVFYNEMPRPARMVSFNMDKAPLDDLNVRLGLAHTFNFEKLFSTVMRGDALRQESMLDGYGKFSSKSVFPRKFDPVKAGEYFDKAGWTERDADGIRMKSGQRLEFKILYYSEPDTPKLILFKEEAKKCGVAFELDTYDSNTVFMSMLDKKHQIAWHGWASGFRPRYWGQFHGDNAHKKKNNNFANINDEQLNKMINDFREAKTDEKRIELVNKIEKRIYDLVPGIPAYKMPYMRYGYWRWIKLPEFVATKTSQYLSDYGLYWIDTEVKKEIKSKMLKNEVIYGTEKVIINETYKPGKGE